MALLQYFPAGGDTSSGYSSDEEQWYSYNIAKDRSMCISSKITGSLSANERRPRASDPCGIGGWLNDDVAVLIYDRFDIWQVDPDGNAPPIDLTSAFSRTKSIQFRIWNPLAADFSYPDTLKAKGPLLLVAFRYPLLR